MRKLFLFLFVLIAIAACFAVYVTFVPDTSFSTKHQYLFVKEGKPAQEQVMQQLDDENILKTPQLFSLMASQLQVWERLKPGRFKIEKGETLLSIIRKLRNNRQAPVRLVINKLRTHEDFASLIAKEFDKDSAAVMSFISNKDSLTDWNVDANNFMTLIIPDTYEFYWNTSLRKIINKLAETKENFWERKERSEKAKQLGLNTQQVYTLASIVEEESNKNDEKGNIASVYLNRMNKGMPLGADPTIRFALKDFTIKRILFGHLNVASPYNTYKNKGLPPGPICTPSVATIDAVLNTKPTNYLYFVAKPGLTGYHQFSATYQEHLQYAKVYQQWLDEYMSNQSAK